MLNTPARNTLAAENLACLRGERAVFARLNFTLESEGALLLSGPNGSGKTSLLRLLAGFSRPAAGHLRWNGVSFEDDREAHAARLQYVGHQDGLKPALTVVENLGFWARLGGMQAVPGLVAGALEQFALTGLADEPARILSAGQRRRLALCRLLVTKASVWLLDEPNAGLDAASVAVLEGIIHQHRRNGGMVVLSSHLELNLPDAQPLALDRFVPAIPTYAEEAWA